MVSVPMWMGVSRIRVNVRPTPSTALFCASRRHPGASSPGQRDETSQGRGARWKSPLHGDACQCEVGHEALAAAADPGRNDASSGSRRVSMPAEAGLLPFSSRLLPDSSVRIVCGESCDEWAGSSCRDEKGVGCCLLVQPRLGLGALGASGAGREPAAEPWQGADRRYRPSLGSGFRSGSSSP
jgi:hypothetical protein